MHQYQIHYSRLFLNATIKITFLQKLINSCYDGFMVDTRFSVSVQIMVTLAYHQDEMMNSEALAKVLKTNATFIRKLVSNLVEAELVESFRGKGGGIKLGKSPADISLNDIYVASTEAKPLISTHKKTVTKACPVSCSFDDIFCKEVVDGIEGVTQSYLSKKYLSDLLKKVSCS